MKALVIGNKGSIGKRHSENLKSLGVEVIGCDLGDSPTHPADFAVIASPTSTHPFWINWCNENRIPFLCEKPVAGSSRDLNIIELIDVSVPHMVACNLRYSSSMDLLRQFINQNEVISFHARVSDSNPSREKYKEGLALQDIHEFDYIQNLFGPILDIDLISDTKHPQYDAFILLESGLKGTLHGDKVCQTYHREIIVEAKSRTITVPIDVSAGMYLRQLEDFIHRLSNQEPMQNTLQEAIDLTKKICEEYEFAN